jgi:FKBP-type peptidyl-prolyl cis-trans isomerase
MSTVRFLCLLGVMGCGGAKTAPPRPPAQIVLPSTSPLGAATTPSGLRFLELVPGTSAVHPEPDSTVRVHYTGWRSDGTVLDSSVERGTPAVFRLTALIPGLSEGLLHMVEGQKMRFWIPAELAYKDRPEVGGPLVFDVELIEVLPD